MIFFYIAVILAGLVALVGIYLLIAWEPKRQTPKPWKPSKEVDYFLSRGVPNLDEHETKLS